MKPISVFIADDYEDPREILKKSLIDFGKQENLEFGITEADTYSSAIQVLEEKARRREYFDIQFIDIDFTGDENRGKADSGFSIIEKAFQICPLSIILTFSAQFKSIKLHPVFVDLVKRGLVADAFDKNASIDNPEQWFEIHFRRIIKDFKENLFLWDIWENNKTIQNYLKDHPVAKDQIANLQIFSEIENYLDTTLMLLMNRGKIGAEHILNRSLLQMYHRALEIYCEGDKSEKEIRELADKNVGAVAAIINKSDLKFTRDDRLSALHKIVAHSASPISKFGYKVNNYRNNAMHQNKKFDVDTANILFGSLALHLYMVPGVKPKIERIREFYNNNSKLSGAKDLKELLGYVSFQIN